ncbi:MAG: acetyl-CoA hydrolase/transferase C-terminal domain-containing protein [Clostridia bacterium]|nr:acetyl-CoA hydrolase/transferase C-terminal domain-containing protein [Clostridia bacterium]
MAKNITLQQALDLIQDGDYIVTGMAAAEPLAFCSALHTIAPRLDKGVLVTNCLPMRPYEYINNPEYRDKFEVEGWFFDGGMRKSFSNGGISFIPNNLHFAGSKRLERRAADVTVVSASMPDKHGYVSVALSNVYEMEHLRKSRISILEINPNIPRVFGDVEIHLDDIDYVVECDYEAPEIPEGTCTEKDMIIGRYVADLINDGDCIQVGIGGIPDAVVASLYGKKNLGVHTEMMTTGIMKLAKAGVVNGRCKQLHPNKIVCCFAAGTKELYRYIDDNPSIMVLSGAYVNNPFVIMQNDNQVSINTTLEIDLTGQCCSESLGSRQFSGTGGQSDTAIGAKLSKNGRSFIALYSTAMIKNPLTGEREEKSKIVAQLTAGAAVSLSRNDIDYLVTEYGCVNLTGTSIKERVEKIISVAHPKFREQLWEDAYKAGIVIRR